MSTQSEVTPYYVCCPPTYRYSKESHMGLDNAKVRNNFLISKKISKNLLIFLFYLYYSSFFEIIVYLCKYIHEAPEELITWIDMNNLNDEDVKKLSQVFDNTSATYKFFWMLGLLDVVNNGRAHLPITFTEMVARKLGKAWQPLLHGSLSFGKCDKLLHNIDHIIKRSPLNMYSLEDRVVYYMMYNSKNEIVNEVVKNLTRNVPYRFLYPWIGTCSNSTAEILSREPKRRCIYFIEGDNIKINPIWINYLSLHRNILEGFAIHRLNCFLAKRNPSFVLLLESNMIQSLNRRFYNVNYPQEVFTFNRISW